MGDHDQQVWPHDMQVRAKACMWHNSEAAKEMEAEAFQGSGGKYFRYLRRHTYVDKCSFSNSIADVLVKKVRKSTMRSDV